MELVLNALSFIGRLCFTMSYKRKLYISNVCHPGGGLLKTRYPNPILGLLQSFETCGHYHPSCLPYKCTCSAAWAAIANTHYCQAFTIFGNEQQWSFGLNLASSSGFQGLTCSGAKCTGCSNTDLSIFSNLVLTIPFLV